MDRATKTLLSWPFVLFAVGIIWMFATVIADGRFLTADILFVLGNLVLGAKFISVYDGLHRQGYIATTFGVVIALSWMMVSWVTLKEAESKPLNTMSVFYVSPPPPSQPLTVFPAIPNEIPASKTKIVKPANGSKGPDQIGSDKEKTKTIPELHPIVLVTTTKVTHTSDPAKISIIITIANTTQTETNTHVEMRAIGFNNGVQTQDQPMSPVLRDVVLGPPPYTFQLTTSLGLSAQGEDAYTNQKAVYVEINLVITYDDRDGKTVYYWEGKTNPDLDQLDATSSRFEYDAKP